MTDPARGPRVLENVAEEWEPLDAVVFGVPESEALHPAGAAFGVRRDVPAADYGGVPVRAPGIAGIVHWRDFAGVAEVELACPEKASGWPQRVQVLLGAYRVGDPPPAAPTRFEAATEDGVAPLLSLVLEADGAWRLVEIDLPPSVAGRPRFLLRIDDRANCPSADRHVGRHLASVQLLGRVTPETTWSAAAAPERRA